MAFAAHQVLNPFAEARMDPGMVVISPPDTLTQDEIAQLKPDFGEGVADPRVYSLSGSSMRLEGILRHNALYPFAPGEARKGTTLISRPELTMDDVPQMRAEFARIRRDDLLLLSFLDKLARCYDGEEGLTYSRLSYEQVHMLACELKKMGLDVNDRQNVGWMLGRILKYFGLRYSRLGCPSRIIAPLIAAMRADLLNVRMTREAAELVFSKPNSPERAIEFLKRAGFSGTDTEASCLGEAMFFMAQVFYEDRPHFFRRDEVFPALCILRKDLNWDLPKEFLQEPAEFIERQTNVRTDQDSEQARVFSHLNRHGFDGERLKRFMLCGMAVVSKRIEPLRVRNIAEEITKARRFADVIDSERIGGVETTEFLGIVYSRGNFYLLMKDERESPLCERRSAVGLAAYEALEPVLSSLGDRDLSKGNVIWHGESGPLVVLDYEGRADIAGLEATPPDSDQIAAARLSVAETCNDFRDVSGGRNLRGYRRFGSVLSTGERVAMGGDGLPTNVAIADIHGNRERLEELLRSEPVMRASTRIFLGDYFDRDTNGFQVFEMLRSRNSPGDVFLLGNHELHFLFAMLGNRHYVDMWLANGGMDFLDSVVDFGEYKVSLEAYIRQLRLNPKERYLNIIFFHEANPNIYRELLRTIQNSDFLRSIFDWIVTKTQFFHIDEYSFAYIHAGIVAASGLNIGYFDWLEAERKRFFDLMRRAADGDTDAIARSSKFTRRFGGHMEIREEQWCERHIRDGKEKTIERLSGFGVGGVVYGHTRRSDIKNVYNRIFNIDLSMAVYYGGLGGMLEIGPGGIWSHKFDDPGSSDLITAQIVSGRDFMALLAGDSVLLRSAFQEHFLHLAG